MLRRICFVIGSRANYSSIKSVMSAVKIDKKLTFQLILSTSSVLQRYGNVSNVIEKDGFKVDEKVFNLIEGETPLTMAKSTGLCLIELSSIFSRLKLDLFVGITSIPIGFSFSKAFPSCPFDPVIKTFI